MVKVSYSPKMTEKVAKNITASQIEADILCEFLEVAFHNILYVRQLYPSGIFERHRKYNVPVQTSSHPEVNEYISCLLRSLQPVLQAGEAEAIAFVVLDKADKPVERFVFEIAAASSQPPREDQYLLRLEQALRSFLLKLNVCDAMLTDNPSGCSWTVQVHTKDAVMLDLLAPTVTQSFTWVEADDRQVQMRDAHMLPLKSMESGSLRMQLYVEEKGEKV